MNNERPLISIGIPVVKTMFVRQAIKCAQEQTYDDLEIVVLNNAATAEVRAEIRAIVESVEDKRIKYFENDSQLPVIENWNKVFSFSKGDFFTLLSDDDSLDKDFISKLYELSLKHPECNVFHPRVVIIDENDKVLRLAPLCNNYEDVLDFIWHRIKFFREQYISNFLVKSEALSAIGGFFYLPDAWGSDDFTWFLIAEHGGIAYTPEPLFYYRENSFSITNTMKIKNKLLANRLFVENVTKLIDRNEQNIKTEMIRKELKTSLMKKNIYAVQGYFNTKKIISKISYFIFSAFYRIYFKYKYRSYFVKLNS